MRRMAQAAVIGAGATAVMDAGAEVLRRTCGTTSLDYALVGRWIGHMPRGVVAHRSIKEADPIVHERRIGWAAHYAIGAGIAIGMAAVRPTWLERPTLIPAVVTGLATTAAPWLCMQPAFGMGWRHRGPRTPSRSGSAACALTVSTESGYGSAVVPCGPCSVEVVSLGA